MKAIVVQQFGGPSQLHLAEDSDPVAGPGQLQVAVHAAGVNRLMPETGRRQLGAAQLASRQRRVRPPTT
jgi:NADPH:quinone reductase